MTRFQIYESLDPNPPLDLLTVNVTTWLSVLDHHHPHHKRVNSVP